MERRLLLLLLAAPTSSIAATPGQLNTIISHYGDVVIYNHCGGNAPVKEVSWKGKAKVIHFIPYEMR